MYVIRKKEVVGHAIILSKFFQFIQANYVPSDNQIEV
jgi:hypothetical protein